MTLFDLPVNVPAHKEKLNPHNFHILTDHVADSGYNGVTIFYYDHDTIREHIEFRLEWLRDNGRTPQEILVSQQMYDRLCV